ncbi:MAG: glycine cleavage system aminomethyltransferase GcvT [Myxococcales bacterium]|nr:glycine cleavage system aminomethyltransferase GcvT [Myxococcales bacterium]
MTAMDGRRTPLYDRHAAAGARFVDFGGWQMPVWYTSIQAEHDAVRTRVGVFDVSHMGEIEIEGDDAVGAFNRLITNDLEAIADGQACYTAMCQPDGGIVDDLVVYRFSRQHVLVCCNASNRDKDFAWIVKHLEGAKATDRGDEYVQLAVQGPAAEALIGKLTDVDLASIGRYWFARGDVAGVPSIIARTGYTGEDGFELYIPAAQGVKVWDALFTADPALVPIGLGARDTLRLEMKYALYGNDIDETTTPLEAGLGWITKLKKPAFIGREALLAQKEAGVPRQLVAFVMEGKAPPRPGYAVVDEAGSPIGRVTSGTRSPTLGTNIGLAYVPTGQHRIGAALHIEVRGRPTAATIVKPPFIQPTARA